MLRPTSAAFGALLLASSAAALAPAAALRTLRHGAAATLAVPRARRHPPPVAAVLSLPSASSVKLSMERIIAPVYDLGEFPARTSWWEDIGGIPKSVVLRRITGHLLFNAAAAGGLCALRHHGCLSGAIPAVTHSLAGAFLGLLVTFRTNSAYARFWEARIIWGGIMNTCRSLAINAKVWISPRSPAAARRFCEALVQYPTAVMHQCRGANFGGPADVCQQMQVELHSAALPSSWLGPGLHELQLAEQARHVDKLVDATGALNRIIKTPLPLAYSRHASRFLTLWCATLPFAMAGAGAAPTIAAVALVSWLVLGIDSIGQLLEQPFSQPKNTGATFDYGLPVEALASGVAAEIRRLGVEA